MTDITVDKKILSILSRYIKDEDFDVLNVLNEFEEDELVFKFKYTKYKSCINAPAARIIINFQEAIYKLVAKELRGKPDIRLLTKEERDALEIPFKISESSTIEEISKLLTHLKKVIEMIPQKQRVPFFITIIILICAAWIYASYCSKEIAEVEYKKEEVKASVAKDDNDNKAEIIKAAIAKLGQKDPVLVKIVNETDEQIITNLSEVDEKVEVQGQEFTSQELKVIKKNKYPKTKSSKPEITTIKGNYKIIAVDLKNSYITVEGSDNNDDVPMRIYYERNTLLSYMQNLKEQLKNAIDDENNIFFIEASIVKQNRKADIRLLNMIKEISQTTNSEK